MRKGESISRIDAQFYVENFNFQNFLKLGEFVRVKGGKRIPKGLSYSENETNFWYLRVDDIDAIGNINFQNMKFISSEIFEILKNYELKKNEVVISNAGTIGKIALLSSELKKKIVLTENCAKLQITNEYLLPQFLKILLMLPIVQKQMTLAYIQTTIPKLALERIHNLKIPKIPKPATQTEIVTQFKAAQVSRQQKEAEAAALLAGIDGYLLDALGITLPPPAEKKTCFYTRSGKLSGGRFDPFYHQSEFEELERILNKNLAVKFANLISVITKGETPLWKGESYTESGIPFLKVQNISIDGIIGKLTYIDENLHVQMARSKLHGGELLYTMAGSIGIATILPNDFGEANINQAIAKIVLKNDIAVNHDYLVDTLNSIICKNQAKQFLTVSAQPNINFEQIKQIKIPLPPLEKQTEIAHHIHQIRAQAKRLQQQAAAELEHAKQQVEQLILGD